MNFYRIPTLLVAGIAVLGLSSADVSAKKRANMSIEEMVSKNMLPPPGYSGHRWVAFNGCDYSRAGRPGETIWYVVSNTRGRKKCDPVIVERAIDGAYNR